jgi:hypothetical protein
MSEPIDMGRRVLGRRMIREGLAFLDELRGKPATQEQALLDIGALSFEALREVGARLSPGVTVAIRDGHLCAERPDEGLDLGVVLELGTVEMVAFNLFDGRHTLGAVAATVASANSCEAEAANECVRALFVRLVRQGVCIPAAVQA